jgi:hypothetical protein
MGVDRGPWPDAGDTDSLRAAESALLTWTKSPGCKCEFESRIPGEPVPGGEVLMIYDEE